MARVALLSFSDGRSFVHSDLASFVAATEDALAAALEAGGHTVYRLAEPVWTNSGAASGARELAGRHADLTIFNYPVWAFPHFSMIAAEATPGPLLLFSNIDPSYPGMVGMLAAGGGLDQIGRAHMRLWGDPAEAEVRAKLQAHVAAAAAFSGLRGKTFGRIGGRPMGMYTAVANTDQWMSHFGIDVEEIDQWELVRLSEKVPASRARAGREWMERHAAGVHYDGERLTPELLERQIRSYHAMRELIEDYRLDFSGIKGQPELTNNFATMDVTEAFLNDPYDWEGPKETHVCATESDMDGALTMQVLKGLTGLPVLFADVRHYHGDLGIWDLCNSGQHATWYAARSDDPAENLARVHLRPEIFYFPAGGASIAHVAAPGPLTLARLSRQDGKYRMQVTRGETVSFGPDKDEELSRLSTYEWPHAFTRIDAGADAFLSRFGANHIHAAPGDLVEELALFCRIAGVRFELLGEPTP